MSLSSWLFGPPDVRAATFVLAAVQAPYSRRLRRGSALYTRSVATGSHSAALTGDGAGGPSTTSSPCRGSNRGGGSGGDDHYTVMVSSSPLTATITV